LSLLYLSIDNLEALYDLLHWNLGQVVMLLSCAFTFFINYIVVLNTTINSALTQAICGNLKVSNVFTHFSIPELSKLPKDFADKTNR